MSFSTLSWAFFCLVVLLKTDSGNLRAQKEGAMFEERSYKHRETASASS